MNKLFLVAISSLLSSTVATTQDICEPCAAAAARGPLTALSGDVAAITNSTGCANGSTTRLFDGVNDPRCNAFGTTTYLMSTGMPPRFDEYLTYAGRGTDFNLGFSRVADRIVAANRTTPPNLFEGYVSSNYGGCARTEGALRQVRRNYCFNFAREMEAKTNAMIDQMFNRKPLTQVTTCLGANSDDFERIKQCFFSTYDKNQAWVTGMEEALITARETAVMANIPQAERDTIVSNFRARFRTFITEWANNARNQIAALTRAKTIARTAALREDGSSAMGGCENMIGELYRAWPELFSFSTGGRNNKTVDYAHCTALQAGVDDTRDRARDRVSRNMVMTIGFAASVVAAPMTAGSSLAVTAAIIAGTASATAGGMSFIEGSRREGLIPLQMTTREIRVNLAGNTPEANREMQEQYRTLRRDINILYATGAVEVMIGVFEAGGGGTMLAERLATRFGGAGAHAAHAGTLANAERLFRRLSDNGVAREVMMDLVVSAGLRFGPGAVEHALLSNHGGEAGH